jgi:hypothetical protein
MVVALGCIILLGSLFMLVAPALRASYQQGQRDLQERLFCIKLRLVRKYYPALHDLTYSEIMEQYDIEALYEDIGRSRYSAVPYHPYSRTTNSGENAAA